MSAKPMPGVEMWVVYFNPKDHPGCFVVRRWVDMTPDREAWLCGSLPIARAHVPAHAVNIGRMAGDDPAIFEVWL